MRARTPKVFLGADHNGAKLSAVVEKLLHRQQISAQVIHITRQGPGDDYPRIAHALVRHVLTDENSFGILLCGSGNGMAMAANRFSGIRAALAPTPLYAKKARRDENANILVLPAWWVTADQARIIVRTWLATPFSGIVRYKRRIKQLTGMPHG